MSYRVRLAGETDLAGWRQAARALAGVGVAPAEIAWEVADADAGLFDGQALPAVQETFSVPRGFLDLAETAVQHSDPERFGRLYGVLTRLRHHPGLIEDRLDPAIARLHAMAKAVRREIHKMHAYVRFRAIQTDEGERFVAWFEPEHHVVEAAAPFFQRRFAAMRWSILTPDRCAHWDREVLTFSDGASRAGLPAEDAAEDLWRAYYASIFNPARLKVSAMRAEMPERYWRNLPEARLIKPLIASAQQRTDAMVAASPTSPPVRRHRLEPAADPAQQHALLDTDLAALRHDAAGCRACPLWTHATQTVFGEGPEDASVVFVGEQPGDKEDLAGRPFVGPAGQLFDRAMAEAGVDRGRAYVTNAVKHFKFEPRGKIRLHKTPGTSEINACRPWMSREIAIIAPSLVVAMGGTAVQSVFGRAVPIMKNRGQVLDIEAGRRGLITVHPSFLLRLPDEAQRRDAYGRFVDDLRIVARHLAEQPGEGSPAPPAPEAVRT